MFNISTKNLWFQKLKIQINEPYFLKLKSFIAQERILYTVYPTEQEVYNAFNLTSFDDVQVIILGQDPYHGNNQANGLSFSVNDGIKIPPSLNNIFKEIKNDIGCQMPNNGNLTAWARQGILLLNATLTVRAGEPGSHQKKGWETFTDSVIKLISTEKQNCVFLLWGNFAKSKKELIDLEKHLVLEAAHPSPLARGAFFGCKHFSKTNEFLASKNIAPINWEL